MTNVYRGVSGREVICNLALVLRDEVCFCSFLFSCVCIYDLVRIVLRCEYWVAYERVVAM